MIIAAGKELPLEQKHAPVLTVLTLGVFAVHSGDEVLSIASPPRTEHVEAFQIHSHQQGSSHIHRPADRGAMI